MKLFKKIVLAIVISLIIVEIVSFIVPTEENNYGKLFNKFHSTRMDGTNTKEITAKYLITGFQEKGPTKYDGEGYYTGFLVSNYSGSDIDSSFEISIDVKYKDEIIIKDAKYIDIGTEKNPILNNDQRIIVIKTTEDVYKRFKSIRSLSKNLYTRINYFKYKDDVKWRKDWLVGGNKWKK